MTVEQEAKTGRRPVGRPAQTKAEAAARREQLVEAAYDVFAEQGYRNAGIADITARLGLGHGTFYRYFEGKRDILDHVVDHAVRKLMTALTLEDLARVDTTAEFRARLTRVGDGLYDEVLDADPRLLRMLLLDAAAIDDDLLQRVLGLMESANAVLATSLREAVHRGFLRQGLDCESAARALLGCAASGVLAELRGAGMSAAVRRRYVDTVVSLLCDNVPPASTGR